ncbi:MAG TPA: helix-turn-helix transcriptional regulator [Pseudonocardiaceae bacterium]|jgi:transcriptional regulator with XRE-family HTH domain|nr:helix-turn-helix transcriptional regulator [Pseudonocardiaceae bacterium]
MTDLGAALRAAREAAGVSLAAMAARTHYSKPLLGLLETGKRTIKPAHVDAYSRALNVPAEILRGPPDDPLRVAHEWLVSDSPALVQLRAGRRVGAMLVDDLESRVIELRHLDDVIGGGDLFPVVSKELSEVQRTVRSASYTDKIARRLLTVTGELAQLAGWVASDAGRYAVAQRIYLDGVFAAQGADDRPLTAQLLSSLSYQIANVGMPGDAVLLARSAVKGAGEVSPVVRALLWERVAWASARSRDYAGTRCALDAVDDAYENRSPEAVEPEWVYWLDRGEIDVMAGRCLIELGSPDAAAPLLARAISSYDTNHAREISLYLSWLAEAYARAGTVDAASATLALARRTAQGTNSTRLDLRINQVENLLPKIFD